MNRDKVIVAAAMTCAIHTNTMSPYLPLTPQQIALDAIDFAKESAAEARIRIRDPKDGKPGSDLILPPFALRFLKKSVLVGMQMDVESALRIGARLLARTFGTEERVEGVRAFLEKREGRFIGS